MSKTIRFALKLWVKKKLLRAKGVVIHNNTVFSGHSYNKGCYMSFLDDDGELINKISIADGYNIRAIDTDGEVITLAAGYDGILVYQWIDNSNIKFLGKITSGYANSVKIKNQCKHKCKTSHKLFCFRAPPPSKLK